VSSSPCESRLPEDGDDDTEVRFSLPSSCAGTMTLDGKKLCNGLGSTESGEECGCAAALSASLDGGGEKGEKEGDRQSKRDEGSYFGSA